MQENVKGRGVLIFLRDEKSKYAILKLKDNSSENRI